MSLDWSGLTAPCTQLLGQPALYAPAVGGGTAIIGVFDAAYKEVLLDREGAPMNSVSPVLGMQPGDLPAPPAKGDQLIIVANPGLYTVSAGRLYLASSGTAVSNPAGKLYTVKDVRPDSHGGAILMLNYTP